MVRPGALWAAALCALTLAASAGAHVYASPAFVRADVISTFTLLVHNDRKEPMSGLTVRVPGGFRIVEAPRAVVGWEGEVRGDLASWRGCCIESAVAATFQLSVDAPDEPGVVDLAVRQLYADGEHVEWPVPLTVVPGDEASRGWWPLAAVAGGLLAAGGVVALVAARRRR